MKALTFGVHTNILSNESVMIKSDYCLSLVWNR